MSLGAGEKTMVSYLVEKGAGVNQTDGRGMTALDTAAMRGNAAAAAELLQIPGVFIEVGSGPVDVNKDFIPLIAWFPHSLVPS